MVRKAPPDDSKARAHRRRRADDTRRWRSRVRRGVQLFKLEAGRWEYDLCVRFAGLPEKQTGNKVAVAAALGRLLRRSLLALLREDAQRR
jgi:hypothetical protein